MAGIVNDVLYGLNADFTGGNSLLCSENNGLVTNGKLWIGSTATNAGGTHINVGSITSPSSTLTMGYSSPNIVMEVTGAATGKVLQGNGVGSPPTYSTATYPATAGTVGNILTSTGTNFTSTAPVLFSIEGTLTNSQIKSLHAVPIQLIAAPGVGKMIKIISSASKLVYGGNNAFTNVGAQAITLAWGTNAINAPSLVINSVIISTTTTTQVFAAFVAESGASTKYDNVAINAYNNSATEIAGNAANDNTINYSIVYQVITV